MNLDSSQVSEVSFFMDDKTKHYSPVNQRLVDCPSDSGNLPTFSVKHVRHCAHDEGCFTCPHCRQPVIPDFEKRIYYFRLAFDHNGLRRFFTTRGKSGGCHSGLQEAIARLISLARKFGVPESEIALQLRGVSCGSPMLGGSKSCVDEIGELLRRLSTVPDGSSLKDVEAVLVQKGKTVPTNAVHSVHASSAPRSILSVPGRQCPWCYSALIHESGCVQCSDHACGWSEC